MLNEGHIRRLLDLGPGRYVTWLAGGEHAWNPNNPGEPYAGPAVILYERSDRFREVITGEAFLRRYSTLQGAQEAVEQWKRAGIEVVIAPGGPRLDTDGKEFWGLQHPPAADTSEQPPRGSDAPTCPSCEEPCQIITRGDSYGTEVSACCEKPLELRETRRDGVTALHLHAVRAGLTDTPDEQVAEELIAGILTTVPSDQWPDLLQEAVSRAARLAYFDDDAPVTVEVEGLPGMP
ncbi:hypothetical protein [Planomonospora sp. ID82291]|uniref:hypothetical protein n=1 Tax=Planomonospora sp. ID82291 TaxID=2738136 RepID=UPI0018C3EC84|nr:hypothetical protein [Planomonospora sp. ID82291]MBG0818447.1 hypothetical protein [Planomonospora sp. ID82291]